MMPRVLHHIVFAFFMRFSHSLLSRRGIVQNPTPCRTCHLVSNKRVISASRRAFYPPS